MLRLSYRESKINVDGVIIHSYHEAPLPIRPFWHRFITAYVVYQFAKYRLVITFSDCMQICKGTYKGTFKRR